MTKDLVLYEYSQNNTGGSFDVDEKLTHRVYIEANSEEEANEKAFEMGIYFDGVYEGIDCECCGDRWYSPSILNMEKINRINEQGGMSANAFGNSEEDAHKEFVDKYGFEPKEVIKSFAGFKALGKVKFNTIQEYIEFLVLEYGWCDPDARIFYADGSVEEF